MPRIIIEAKKNTLGEVRQQKKHALSPERQGAGKTRYPLMCVYIATNFSAKFHFFATEKVNISSLKTESAVS